MFALSEGVFTSKLFTFLVGENKRAIAVHAEAIVKHSPALNVLINGEMIEAKNGESESFEDVDEETFVRFCQFAYLGDYETPVFSLSQTLDQVKEPSKLPVSAADQFAEVDVRVNEMMAESYDWDYAKKTFKKKEKLSKSRELRSELNQRVYDIVPTQTMTKAAIARCEIRENENPEEDYTPVLLGHAQLYVFADKWGIEALKTLALYKLHKTLVTFTLYEKRRTDIVELVKFVYENEHTPDLDHGNVDALRVLVTHYVTCELENLIGTPEFQNLLEGPGSFSRDLVKMMMRRI